MKQHPRMRQEGHKRSRGFPWSAVRNAAPIAFLLPDEPAPLLQEVVMREEDDFEPQFTVSNNLPPRNRLGLRLVGEELRVQLPAGFGVPVRTHRPTATLRRGEWLRWQMNNRYSSMSGMADWHYVLQTVNLGFSLIPRNAFLGDPPRLVDERAALR